MKKSLIFLVILLFIPISFAETMKPSDTIDFNGREITLIGIQESKVLISVDGVKNIISLNQQEIINGVKINLVEIFDAGEFATADLNFELSYSCGDSQCDEFENQQNCCKDCGCSGTFKCVENSCITPECTQDSQCSDNNELTEDYCSDFKCKHRNIKCKSNSECNDNNPDTDDSCNKGKCQNFLNYVCKVNEDCEDDNPCTLDECINKDCKNTLKEDCEFKEIEESDKEEQQEEAKSNLEENVKEFRGNLLTKIVNWFKNLFS